MDSPWKSAGDSPSRQLLTELGRLRISLDRSFVAQLEKDSSDRERIHRTALAAAAAEHERVRHSAEIARERFQLEVEKERRRREDEERRELDRKRQEKTDRELAEMRREIERAKTEEAERKKRAAEERAKAEADAEEGARAKKREEEAAAAAAAAEAKRRVDEAEKRKKAEAERQAQDEAAAAAVAAKAKPQPTAPSPKPPLAVQPPPTSSTQSPAKQPDITRKEEVHRQYLEIHQRLKKLRKSVIEHGKRNPTLKSQIGDMRREIKKCVGQLTEGKGANKTPISKIMTVLRQGLTIAEPTVDIRDYLLPHPSYATADPSTTQAPALLVYLINIFSKSLISQFIDEAGVSPRAADPVGVVAAQVFATKEFQFSGAVPLIDILLAKFHLVCPVLWGIYGPETSNAGKTRLGWWRDEGAHAGSWVSEQRHGERMTGLGAGFAALALRNFEKSRLDNPFPNAHYWRAVAAIVNVPPAHATHTHFLVLKAMIEGYEERFLGFYGSAALAALRLALVQFPRAAPKSVAASAMAVLPDVIKRDKRLTLAV